MMARKQHVDTGVRRRIQRQLARPAARFTSPVSPTGNANRGWCVTSTRSDFGSVRSKVSRMNCQLLVADPAVLEGQRSRGVDAEHASRRAARATGKAFRRCSACSASAATGSGGRRRTAARRDCPERRARRGQHRAAARGNCSFLELLGPRALREIAADDDEVGLLLVDALLNRLDQPRIVRAEMQVGQDGSAGPFNSNALAGGTVHRLNGRTWTEPRRTPARAMSRERLRFDEAALDRWLARTRRRH